MTLWKKMAVMMVLAVAFGAAASRALADCSACAKPDAGTAQAAKAQTKCPIQGEPINKAKYVEADGYRIYACCEGCLAKIKADPAAALAKIKAHGETPEKVAAVCPKDGNAQSSGDCCKPRKD